MSDIDIERFVPLPDPELICPICHSILHNPYETPCQHVFCKVCIYTWIYQGLGSTPRVNKCPSCRSYVHQDEMKMALPILNNLINNLKVRCINNPCPQLITKEYLTDHEKRCDHAMIGCSNPGCTVSMVREEAERHRLSCKLQIVPCPNECQLSLPKYKLKDHSCLQELKQELKEQYLEAAVLREIIHDMDSTIAVSRENLRTNKGWFSANLSLSRARYMSNYRHDDSSTLKATESETLHHLASQMDPFSSTCSNANGVVDSYNGNLPTYSTDDNYDNSDGHFLPMSDSEHSPDGSNSCYSQETDPVVNTNNNNNGSRSYPNNPSPQELAYAPVRDDNNEEEEPDYLDYQEHARADDYNALSDITAISETSDESEAEEVYTPSALRSYSYSDTDDTDHNEGGNSNRGDNSYNYDCGGHGVADDDYGNAGDNGGSDNGGSDNGSSDNGSSDNESSDNGSSDNGNGNHQSDDAYNYAYLSNASCSETVSEWLERVVSSLSPSALESNGEEIELSQEHQDSANILLSSSDEEGATLPSSYHQSDASAPVAERKMQTSSFSLRRESNGNTVESESSDGSDSETERAATTTTAGSTVLGSVPRTGVSRRSGEQLIGSESEAETASSPVTESSDKAGYRWRLRSRHSDAASEDTAPSSSEEDTEDESKYCPDNDNNLSRHQQLNASSTNTNEALRDLASSCSTYRLARRVIDSCDDRSSSSSSSSSDDDANKIIQDGVDKSTQAGTQPHKNQTILRAIKSEPVSNNIRQDPFSKGPFGPDCTSPDSEKEQDVRDTKTEHPQSEALWIMAVRENAGDTGTLKHPSHKDTDTAATWRLCENKAVSDRSDSEAVVVTRSETACRDAQWGGVGVAQGRGRLGKRRRKSHRIDIDWDVKLPKKTKASQGLLVCLVDRGLAMKRKPALESLGEHREHAVKKRRVV